ncbi:MAG: hypothetical protein JOZ87_23000 [Chloroflexi bacterium]|nr:hypothetical protein [Chloroflexota bacterium]
MPPSTTRRKACLVKVVMTWSPSESARYSAACATTVWTQAGRWLWPLEATLAMVSGSSSAWAMVEAA